jgi:Fur family transcriptional regulator, ferric uptake regulator
MCEMRPSIRSPRDTAPRRTLAQLIGERQGHFTAADLLAEAESRKVKIGRATVFRTLDLLAEQGALERLDLPSGEHAYVACAPQDHHHHVVCRNCGASAEVEDEGLQAVVRDIGAQSGYRIENHRLELYGLCPRCQRSGAK